MVRTINRVYKNEPKLLSKNKSLNRDISPVYQTIRDVGDSKVAIGEPPGIRTRN